MARHYQGGGSFLEQCYTTFLPLAPFFLLGSVISMLLVIDSTSHVGAFLVLIELLLFIYSSILLVVSLKAVHGVTTWEAIAMAILPIFSILVVLVIVLIVIAMINSSGNGDNNNSNNNNSSNKQNNTQNNAANSDTNGVPQQTGYYRNNNYWWWSGPRYVSSSANQSRNRGPHSKRQWFCTTCRYRRWARQGPTEMACLRCSMPMRATGATR